MEEGEDADAVGAGAAADQRVPATEPYPALTEDDLKALVEKLADANGKLGTCCAAPLRRPGRGLTAAAGADVDEVKAVLEDLVQPAPFYDRRGVGKEDELIRVYAYFTRSATRGSGVNRPLAPDRDLAAILHSCGIGPQQLLAHMSSFVHRASRHRIYASHLLHVAVSRMLRDPKKSTVTTSKYLHHLFMDEDAAKVCCALPSLPALARAHAPARTRASDALLPPGSQAAAAAEVLAD